MALQAAGPFFYVNKTRPVPLNRVRRCICATSSRFSVSFAVHKTTWEKHALLSYFDIASQLMGWEAEWNWKGFPTRV